MRLIHVWNVKMIRKCRKDKECKTMFLKHMSTRMLGLMRRKLIFWVLLSKVRASLTAAQRAAR